MSYVVYAFVDCILRYLCQSINSLIVVMKTKGPVSTRVIWFEKENNAAFALALSRQFFGMHLKLSEDALHKRSCVC